MPTEPSQDRERDRRFMASALRLGRNGLGRTAPNPSVGAVVVRTEGNDAIVVGRGCTAPGGRPHAETVALEQAGEAARGATLYATLEPCSHEGQAPPCINAIKAAGIGRVVMTVDDPDPRVGGRGRQALEEAGIAVTTGVLADEARRDHAGHFSRVERGRPHINLKLAVSADGMIGKREGERMIITGPPALAAVQIMRAQADAVMVGIGTVLVDDPRLTVRLPGLLDRSPLRVVVDPSARIPIETKLVSTARELPVACIVGPDAPADKKTALEAAGVTLIETGEGQHGFSLPEAMSALSDMGITRLLVEGGAKLAASLFEEDLLDEIVLFRAPVVVGPDGVRALEGYAMSAIERSPRYRQIETGVVGEDRLRRYWRS